jgi:hypothetical protein
MPELVVYEQFDDMKFILNHRIMTFLEYQPDGLTIRFDELKVENPQGFLLCHHNRVLTAQSHSEKILNMIQAGAYEQIANKKYKTKNQRTMPGIWRVLLNPLCGCIAKRYLIRTWHRNGNKF